MVYNIHSHQQSILYRDNEENDTDNESYDSYDSDDNSDTTNTFYDSEEKSNTKYNIVLCEIYNDKIHGQNNVNDVHYIVISRFKQLNLTKISEISDLYHLQYTALNINRLCHNKIRNYDNIVKKTNYIKPEIAECIYLNGSECVCIIKTIWIRLIQRTWKKIFKNKQDIVKKRCHMNSLLYRQIHGKWPSSCFNVPSISGMLSYLK